jgi:hypothetical protein
MVGAGVLGFGLWLLGSRLFGSRIPILDMCSD